MAYVPAVVRRAMLPNSVSSEDFSDVRYCTRCGIQQGIAAGSEKCQFRTHAIQPASAAAFNATFLETYYADLYCGALRTGSTSKRQERTAVIYSITSSTRANSDGGGTSRSSALITVVASVACANTLRDVAWRAVR